MTASLIIPLMLGVDGFAVCFALGPVGLGFRRAVPLVALFGLTDGLALLAGGAFHPSLPWSPAILPGLMGLWLVLVLLLMLRRARMLVPLLPILLAFDNLLAGAASDRAATLGEAALSCAVSAALAGAGLLAGHAWARRLDPVTARLAGTGLLLAAGFVAMAG